MAYVTAAVHNPASVLVVTFAGQLRKTGSSASLTVTVNEQEAVLPDPSVAVKEMV